MASNKLKLKGDLGIMMYPYFGNWFAASKFEELGVRTKMNDLLHDNEDSFVVCISENSTVLLLLSILRPRIPLERATKAQNNLCIWHFF